MQQHIQDHIITLKIAIGQTNAKDVFLTHSSIIKYLLSVERIKIIELSNLLSLPLSTVRTYLSKNNIKVKNDHPDFITRVCEFYENNNTIASCQVKFRLGFQEVKQILGSAQRKRGKALTNDISITDIRILHKTGMSLSAAAGTLQLTKAQLQKWILNQGYNYKLDSLHHKEIIELYINKNLTVSQISKQYFVTPGNIRQVLTKHSIVKRADKRKQSLIQQTNQQYGVNYYSQTNRMKTLSKLPKKKETKQITKTTLHHYINQNYTLQQIGTILSLSDSTIASYLNKFNIPYENKENRLQRIKTNAGEGFIIQAKEMWKDRFVYLTTYVDSKTKIIIYCKKHHHEFKQLPSNHLRSVGCKFCQPSGYSLGEREVTQEIRKFYKGIILENTRKIISPKEIDIFIPEFKLAIEFNGLYWHSFGKTDVEDKRKHLRKTEDCENKNITLFQIFENEWNNSIKQEIWLSKIKGYLQSHRRIFARKTNIVILTNKQANLFCNTNHLQGQAAHKVAIGIEYNSRLLAVATFAPARFLKNKEIWELVRFCSLLNTTIVGGFSKILKYFIKTHTSIQLISYANRRWSRGKVYDTAGFTQTNITTPNYFYTKDCRILENRMKYQKHKLSKILDTFDEHLTESENMFNNGYRRIWDCGNLVYKLNS